MITQFTEQDLGAGEMKTRASVINGVVRIRQYDRTKGRWNEIYLDNSQIGLLFRESERQVDFIGAFHGALYNTQDNED